MFWLFILFLVGSSYVFYKYRSVSNKELFFKSPLFRSLLGSLLIFLVAVVIVNLFASDSGGTNYEPVIVRDTLDETTMDTSAHYLLSQKPAFHYHRIHRLEGDLQYLDYFRSLKSAYTRFASSPDTAVSSLGNFCLGVVSMQEARRAEAAGYFHSVSNNRLPYLHYCLGELLLMEDKQSEALTEYQLEMQNEGGNWMDAYTTLIRLYESDKDYEHLRALLEHPLADDYFPDHLANETLLYVNDWSGYIAHAFLTLADRTSWIGFWAALLISITWLIYIFRLNVFKRSPLFNLVAMFFSGAFFVLLLLPFNDLMEVYTTLSINGGFWNDLFYCIFIIGVPEEFVKALPLLLLLLFGKRLDPVNYIVYGAASALGFAFVENILYFYQLKDGIIHGRAYLSVIGHMVDTSFVAYGIVWGLYQIKDKRSLRYLLPLSFMVAAGVHGLYDFLLFHNQLLLFFLFFIFIVQLWIIVINNCLNNSSYFTYSAARKTEHIRIFITLALTAIFVLEYMVVGFSSHASLANVQLLRNSGVACFLIVFFSTNLSSFDLIKGYWRTIRFVSREKRGYGGRQARTLLTSWYFVNAVQSHNYVGLDVIVYNDQYNRTLGELLDGEYEGKIVNRITLYEDHIADPQWFLVKMTRLLPFDADRPDYVLVKLRFQEDSLLYEDEVQVFFKSITDAAVLRESKPPKEAFPFYGWAYIRLNSNPGSM